MSIKVLILGKNGFISKYYQNFFKSNNIEYDVLSFTDDLCPSLNLWEVSFNPIVKYTNDPKVTSETITALRYAVMQCAQNNSFSHMCDIKNIVSERFYNFKEHIRKLVEKINNYNLLSSDKKSQAGGQYTHLINCVGYTGIKNIDDIVSSDECQLKSLLLNLYLPIYLTEHATSIPTFCHISTGCMYYSYKNEYNFNDGWREYEFYPVSKNASIYSIHKSISEIGILNNKIFGRNVYLWRLRIPFCSDKHNKNYLTKLLTYKKLLSMPNSLTGIDSFVKTTTECMALNFCHGLYNIANPGSITAEEICEMFKEYGLVRRDHEFKFWHSQEDMVQELNLPQNRSNCTLNTDKILNAMQYYNSSYSIPHVRDEIVNCIKNYK